MPAATKKTKQSTDRKRDRMTLLFRLVAIQFDKSRQTT